MSRIATFGNNNLGLLCKIEHFSSADCGIIGNQGQEK
jgi:hypothetical protein